MEITANILKEKLRNVYFIWGSGKTIAANTLSVRYGFPVYHTDYERARYFEIADPGCQPAMCRDVPDFWALEKDDALAWEGAIVKEFTPMAIADLIALAAVHPVVLCEGDIDIAAVVPIQSHAVTIWYTGTPYDFFDRPDQRNMLDAIRNDPSLTQDEKEARIANACAIVAPDKNSRHPRQKRKNTVSM